MVCYLAGWLAGWQADWMIWFFWMCIIFVVWASSRIRQILPVHFAVVVELLLLFFFLFCLQIFSDSVTFWTKTVEYFSAVCLLFLSLPHCIICYISKSFKQCGSHDLYDGLNSHHRIYMQNITKRYTYYITHTLTLTLTCVCVCVCTKMKPKTKQTYIRNFSQIVMFVRTSF